MAAASSSAEPLPPVVSRNSIKVIAESVGIAHLKDEVADALAPDVEYRLRDLVQEALKFAKHGRRETLTTDDINYALRLRNCEPLYGFASADAPRFCRALTPGVFYLEDPELNLADLLAEPLPRMPIEPSFTTHWLAINGVQPDVPQNPDADDVAAASGKATGKKRLRDAEEGAAAEGAAAGGVTPLAKHALSAEEQTWLDKVTSAVQGHTANEEGIIDAEKQRVRRRPAQIAAPRPRRWQHPCVTPSERRGDGAGNGARALCPGAFAPPRRASSFPLPALSRARRGPAFGPPDSATRTASGRSLLMRHPS